MDFVSNEFLIWSVVFMAVVWLPVKNYLSHYIALSGSVLILILSPVAGSIVIAESLFCYYHIRFSRNIQWIYTITQIAIVLVAFLLCKFLSTNHSIIFPVGISYFTFRLIHYLQENYRQRLRTHTFSEFLAYMTFFPTFLVGPINLFPDFLTNLRRRKWDTQQFSYGIERVIFGFAQLIILGNFLINFVLKNWFTSHTQSDNVFFDLIVHSVQLWIDLYIRFSAYSSIAIGLSAMAGFTIPENFHYPFFATNIRVFWQRWHISLTGWCREYIYVPIASITKKPFLAISATMISIGIWHELSLRYILWGFYHSMGIIVFEKYSRLIKNWSPANKTVILLQKFIGITLTIIFIVLSFPVTIIINDYLKTLFH